MCLADTVKELEDLKKDFSDDRTHNAIGYNVPISLQIRGNIASPQH